MESRKKRQRAPWSVKKPRLSESLHPQLSVRQSSGLPSQVQDIRCNRSGNCKHERINILLKISLGIYATRLEHQVSSVFYQDRKLSKENSNLIFVKKCRTSWTNLIVLNKSSFFSINKSKTVTKIVPHLPIPAKDTLELNWVKLLDLSIELNWFQSRKKQKLTSLHACTHRILCFECC